MLCMRAAELTISSCTRGLPRCAPTTGRDLDGLCGARCIRASSPMAAAALQDGRNRRRAEAPCISDRLTPHCRSRSSDLHRRHVLPCIPMHSASCGMQDSSGLLGSARESDGRALWSRPFTFRLPGAYLVVAVSGVRDGCECCKLHLRYQDDYRCGAQSMRSPRSLGQSVRP